MTEPLRLPGYRPRSRFDAICEESLQKVWQKIASPGGWLFEQIKRHARWAQEGFEPGYSFAEREAFTKTVEDRIYWRGRAGRYRFLGIPLWAYRYSPEWCAEEAEEMVSRFLESEGIKFGDPNFYWDDGHDIADEEMSEWEKV